MGYSEKTIAGIFHNRAEKYQFEPFLKHKKQGRYTAISWREMQKLVTKAGLGLISLGVKKNDILTIFSENCWQWLVADLATLSIGAADAPIYATNSGEESAYIINDSGSRFLFVSDQEHLDRILSVRTKIKGLKKIITFEPIQTGAKDIMSFDELLDLGEKYKDKKAFDERLSSIDPEGLATLIYTSGTTGPPKGVMLTHANFTANILQGYASHPMIGHHDEALLLLPWSHSFGRTVGIYLMIHVGALLSLAENFGSVMQNMTEIRPTIMVSVPRLFEKIHAGILSKAAQASPVKKKLFSWALSVAGRAVDFRVQRKVMPLSLQLQYDTAEKLVYSGLKESLGMDRIKLFINGGGPLSVDIDRFFNAVGVTLHNGYGLTETTPVTNVNTFEVFEFGSVGPALADTHIKIAPDGEILIKGPQIMKGYFNKPEETRAVFTNDGWFMTGDIGKIDERGCLYITDRKKDIIVTAGGKSIAPQNIENTLAADLFIEQAVVIGEGRKYVSALIVPNYTELISHAKKQGISFDKKEDLIVKPEILSFYRTRIDGLMKNYSRAEQIRKFILLPREFGIEYGELTPTLKMKRKAINQNFSSEIESMYKEGE